MTQRTPVPHNNKVVRSQGPQDSFAIPDTSQQTRPGGATLGMGQRSGSIPRLGEMIAMWLDGLLDELGVYANGAVMVEHPGWPGLSSTKASPLANCTLLQYTGYA